jgi:LmbE family N-acetylglucosaminyl deacetylase
MNGLSNFKDTIKNTIKQARGSFLRQSLRFTALSSSLSDSRTVVISPHPDDESLGCGGMIALRKSIGSQVKVIFLTNGEASHRGCCNTSGEVISARRRQHALEALSVLGVDEKDIYWLGLPDSKIPGKDGLGFEDAVNDLSKLLLEINPQVVYTPHLMDGWLDHKASTEIALTAIEHSEMNCSVHYYCIRMWYNSQLRNVKRLTFNV